MGAYIDVTAPSSIDLGILNVGDNFGASDPAGSVACNAGTWSVTAMDNKSVEAGYMTSQSGPLTNELLISANSEGWFPASTGVTYSGNPTILDFYVNQELELGDMAGAYSIDITFEGVIA